MFWHVKLILWPNLTNCTFKSLLCKKDSKHTTKRTSEGLKVRSHVYLWGDTKDGHWSLGLPAGTPGSGWTEVAPAFCAPEIEEHVLLLGSGVKLGQRERKKEVDERRGTTGSWIYIKVKQRSEHGPDKIIIQSLTHAGADRRCRAVPFRKQSHSLQGQ